MLLISSASNSELHLILGFSNLETFYHLSCYVDIILFHIVFLALNSLNHSAFLSCSFLLFHMLLQNCLLSSVFIWFFTVDISYTIHLLINSFLILDKHSVDLILVHSLLISLQLCCFCMELLFQLFYHCSYSFFLYVILPFKFLIFSFLFISPLW